MKIKKSFLFDDFKTKKFPFFRGLKHGSFRVIFFSFFVPYFRIISVLSLFFLIFFEKVKFPFKFPHFSISSGFKSKKFRVLVTYVPLPFPFRAGKPPLPGISSIRDILQNINFIPEII